ncbi:TPA: M16 family metallopeptidase [Streptococcus suis]|nr:insulinase family protein [Streptococcus suis]
MKLQEGVYLHFIDTDKFTTNRIKMRFAAPMSAKTVAGRVLAANILELANEDYPTAQAFRRKLATLYGAQFSTSVAKRGKVHFVDITISYVRADQLPDKEDLTGQLIDFIYSALFRPLKERNGFDSSLFEVEKKNLLSYLEAEVEDNFYHADVELSKLFYENEDVQIPRVARLDLVEQETAETAYKALRDMLKLDRIDIFVLGKVDKKLVQEGFERFAFTYRNPKLELELQQNYSNITREKIERKEARQSVLELAYHLQVVYNDVNYTPLLVLNGLFGGFSHSKLFMNVREKESLAYTIGSSVSIFSGMMKVYAGIDKENRLRTMQLIRRQLQDIKKGNFSEEDLSMTKSLLVNAATLAQDQQANLVEQAYNQAILGERNLEWEEWVEAVNLVSREDILRVARCIRLQAIYFMEGEEDGIY